MGVGRAWRICPTGPGCDRCRRPARSRSATRERVDVGDQREQAILGSDEAASHAQRNTYADPDAACHSEPEHDTNPHPDTATRPRAAAVTNAGADPHPNARAHADADPRANARTHARANPGTHPGANPGTHARA